MYYNINEETARAAKHSYSFSEYISGSATAEYKRMVDKAIALGESRKAELDPEYHAEIDRLVDLYARRLAENINRGNEIETRCPSILIAGGGNFNVRKKEKQNAARDKNMEQYNQIQGILDSIRKLGTGGIRSDDKNAIVKLKNKLADLQEQQENMKAINAYYRKHKTLDGYDLISKAAKNQILASMARSYRTNPVPFESWALSNNNANIHRIKERISALEKEQEKHQETEQEQEYNGFILKENTDVMRIQFIFDEKPDEQTRTLLKSHGFRWAPSEGAWQRMLNDNGRFAARTIISKLKEG